jgi:hypothetical protein
MKKPQSEKLLHEIFEDAQAAKTQVERMDILREHDGFVLSTVLQLAFSKSIVLDFPSGPPPYKENDAPSGLEYSRLKNILSPIGNCVKGNGVAGFKKEKILIGILEAVHPDDAKLIIAAKDKCVTKLYSKITEKLMEKAYPKLLK